MAEVALSFVLLLGAGLLIESFRQLLRVDPGFRTSNLLTLRLDLERESSVNAFAVRKALERLPGVRSVALSSTIPLTGGPAVFYAAEGQSTMDATNAPRAYFHFITPGFLRTMEIPLLGGRDFTLNERPESVIVTKRVTNRFWPGQDPIGKRMRMGRNNPNNPWLNIIGVVGDSKTRGLPENPTQDPDVYFPLAADSRTVGVLLRTEVEPGSLIAAVRSEIRQLDKLALVGDVATMEERIRPRTARARFLSGLSGVFSATALVLVLVGIYGAMSYMLAQRTREIGIRIAVGARRADIFRIVLGPAFVLIAVGLAVGLVGGFFVGRGIAGLLFGVRALEPSVFIGVSVFMIVTGLSAAYIPARRAVAVDPIRALREE